MTEPAGEYYLVPTSNAPRGEFLPSDQRDAEASRLLALNWSASDIAERLGYPSISEAINGARRAVAEAIRFARDEQRFMEVRGLNEIERRLWQKLDEHVVLVQHGKIVLVDDVPLEDARFALEVIDRLLKVKEQRARLLGLNMPTRDSVISIDSVNAEIARLEKEIGSLE